ncbi:MAG: hypothetical protein N4J56_001716 [Chroococcidiopsis sp. SAG 2025]|uniref:hypothetical protein n=1 Tax=Chroococcidiopsis sp. SAG 2025 TaxID=171389 RepID=UPI002936DE88|nr:hypothetical protein [Chroococcidiopsis sp. SAG 2025]MDV2992062.1 hypothetical protein [Chroococcidiopsis sp. SAG 2025]
MDGKSLTAAEYAQLQAKLQTRPAPPTLNSQVREIVFLLQLRKAIRTFYLFAYLREQGVGCGGCGV